MFKKYKIDLDKDDFFKGLDLMNKDKNRIAKRMMAKVAQSIRKDVKNKNLKGGLLKKQKGLLFKSISYKTKNDMSATISSNTPYSSTHEMGKTILPKNKPYLAFQVDGEWRRVKQVVIPQRQFLYPVIDDYFSTNKAEQIMDKIFQQALDEIFEKGK